MSLTKKEQKEWTSLKAKSKRWKIPIKRVGSANVSFGNGVYTQLGIGRATTIMNARITLKKKKKTNLKN